MGSSKALKSIACVVSALLLACLFASQACAAPSLYFVDYFDETGQTPTASDPLAGLRFIHWQYNSAQTQYTSVKVYKGKTLLATVPKASQPAYNYYNCVGQTAGTVLTVKPVTSGGQIGTGVNVTLTINGSLPVSSIGRIGVVGLADRAVLYDVVSGQRFYPRGCNYVRLDQSAGYHTTFEAQTSYGPQLYDPYTAEAMFRTMKSKGYNMVRVFQAGQGANYPGIGGEPGTGGLYTPYLDNLADFIARGAKYGMYTLITGIATTPANEYFAALSGGANNSIYWRGIGPTVLTPAGMSASLETFDTTLRYLNAKNANLLKAVLLQYHNEDLIYLGDPPFNGTGNVTTADGNTYNMSDNTTGSASRSACGKNGWTYYFGELYDLAQKSPIGWMLTSESISVGVDYRAGDAAVFTGTSNRIQPSAVLMTQGPHVMDFFDMHMYPHNVGSGSVAEFDNLYRYMQMDVAQSSGFLPWMPFIMGEFGTDTTTDPTWTAAKTRILNYRNTAINGGCLATAAGFQMWTLDSFEQTGMWSAMEDSGTFLTTLNNVSTSIWPSPPPTVTTPNPFEAASVPFALATASQIQSANPGWHWGAANGVTVDSPPASQTYNAAVDFDFGGATQGYRGWYWQYSIPSQGIIANMDQYVLNVYGSPDNGWHYSGDPNGAYVQGRWSIPDYYNGLYIDTAVKWVAPSASSNVNLSGTVTYAAGPGCNVWIVKVIGGVWTQIWGTVDVTASNPSASYNLNISMNAGDCLYFNARCDGAASQVSWNPVITVY